MSGKGSSGGGGGKGGNTQPNSSSDREPEIVSGWQYHQYAQGSPDRYVYIGKDDDGTPEFLDYGPKGGRR